MLSILVTWLLQACALLAVAGIYSGVQVKSYGSALVAAAVIGLLNTFVKPILTLLTLPVTIITVGLFLFVLNALMFYWAASLIKGFSVNGFGAALLGSLIYSVLGLIIGAVVARLLA